MTREQRAVMWNAIGGPDELYVAEVPIPTVGEQRVLVRVSAVGVNPYDVKLLTGAAVQDKPFPRGICSDVAGVVVAVGDGAEYVDGTPISVGDRVFGWGLNTLREQLVVRAASIARIPDAVSDSVAAALTTPALAALACWREVQVTSSDTVVISGASGTVGGLLTQFSLRAGARVIGTASAANVPALTAQGVVAVAYGDGLVERLNTLDTVGTVGFDVGGRPASAQLIAAGIPAERVVTLSGESPPDGVIVADTSKRSAAALAEVIADIASGALRYDVANEFPLEQAADAFRAVQHGDGKSVVLPNAPSHGATSLA